MDIELWHQEAMETWSADQGFSWDLVEENTAPLEEADQELSWGLNDFFRWLFYEDTHPLGKFFVYFFSAVILGITVFLVIRGISRQAQIDNRDNYSHEQEKKHNHALLRLPEEQDSGLGEYLQSLYHYFIDYLSRKKLLPASAFLTNREIRHELKDKPREMKIFIPLSRMSEEVLYGHRPLVQSELKKLYSAMKELP